MSEWISINEQTPAAGEVVLFMDSNREDAYRYFVGWISEDDPNDICVPSQFCINAKLDDITHWMPIPILEEE